MTISATVAEFNPFHNGHKYLVEKMRENSQGVVAVMSGNYVQRGGCAVYDKFTRAQVAVQNGVDLVIELPLIYSLSSAEYFALGAVEILNALGVASELWFGSEAGSLAPLNKIACELINESEAFKEAMKAALGGGMGFALARQKALEAVLGNEARFIARPNNILGVEYIKALMRTQSKIRPVTVKRIQARHDCDQRGESIASAKSLRESLSKGESIADYVPSLPEAAPVGENSFNKLIAARLISASKEELTALPDCNEEIAARLKKAAGEKSVEEIIRSAHSKNYADSRLRRILFNLLLGNKVKYTSPQYIRPLAFNREGAEILRAAKDRATLPVVSRAAMAKESEIFAAECIGTDIYSLAAELPLCNEFIRYPEMTEQ